MRPGARINAAVEVLTEVLERHRPASVALADWGKSHRFAGSGDRAAIGNLVYDALRRRQSLAARMGSASARALAIAAASGALALSPEEVIAVADGVGHALPPLSATEQAGLRRDLQAGMGGHVEGDYPEWLAPSFARAFGDRAAEEGKGLACRAPVDIRVNTLKADRDKLVKALSRHAPEPTVLSPVGLRIRPPEGPGRTPNLEAEPAHGKGWFEIQDEGSQIAALMTGASPRQQVLDLCAGAGGKTLAMAAQMKNTGQIYAYDSNAQQLRPIFERLKRAGVRNAQVLDAGGEAALEGLGARFDVVLVDAPCTGSGVWRRRPDAKWRVKPANLEERQSEQRRVLDQAARCVRNGGRIVYVTCSVLPEENSDTIAWFCSAHD
ncbi:MAG: RsmB/NOP family class I SAM-dependent RNA methyltransferase, partial [Hyphomicrobiaceae bacterium]